MTDVVCNCASCVVGGFPYPCRRIEQAELEARVRTQVAAELELLRAQIAHFRDEWTIAGDSTWLWINRILAGEQGCTEHPESARRHSGMTGADT